MLRASVNASECYGGEPWKGTYIGTEVVQSYMCTLRCGWWDDSPLSMNPWMDVLALEKKSVESHA